MRRASAFPFLATVLAAIALPAASAQPAGDGLTDVQRSGRQIFVSTHSTELLHDTGIGLDEVLLLNPSAEGTVVSTASSHADIKTLLEGGVPLAEIIIPRTRPADADQLSLFGDGA